MSATQVQLRRGSFNDNTGFLGASGELTLDTTNWRIVLHDSIITGGYTGASFKDITGLLNINQTGQFYPSSNIQQYVNSGNLQSTGLLILGLSGALQSTGSNLQSQINTNINNLQLTGQNLNSKIILLSGQLNITGSILNNRINLLSGLIPANIVYTTGDQTIFGNKVFNTQVTTDIISGLVTNFVINLNDNHILKADNVIVDFGNQIINDSTSSNVSVDWGNRQLSDNNGDTSIDWANRTTYHSNGSDAVVWNEAKLRDKDGNDSLNWSGRIAYDSNSVPSVAWETKQLSNGDGVTIDWTDLKLYDSNGYPSYDWGNKQIFAGGGPADLSIDGSSRLLAVGTVNTVNWGGAILADFNNTGSMDWQNRQLLDSNQLLSIDYKNRGLYDSSGIQNCNYNSRQLIQSWTIGSKQSEKLNFNGGANGSIASSVSLTIPVSINTYGGNSKLMGNPTGFLDINISGIAFKIPYYK